MMMSAGHQSQDLSLEHSLNADDLQPNPSKEKLHNLLLSSSVLETVHENADVFFQNP